MKTKQKIDLAEEKSFLQRFAPAFAVIIVFLILIAAIVGTVKVLKREAPKSTVPVVVENLPGPKGNISRRSMREIETVSKQYPHILGTFVTRYHYTKRQHPFVYIWTNGNPAVDKVINKINNDLAARQASDKAMSSDEVERERAKDPVKVAQTLRNSEEAKLGLIKCIPIREATLNYPVLATIATGICYATIPPFTANAGMAIVMLTDSELTQYTELAEMRRILLSLQINIFNRDFEGRETWAHP